MSRFVGRFVEQQHVRPREQRLCKQVRAAQARATSRIARVQRLGNAGIQQDAGGAGFGVVAVVLRKLPSSSAARMNSSSVASALA